MTQTVTLATSGAPIEGVEVRRVGRQGRFALTRYPFNGQTTDWTITHVASGRSVGSLIPAFMPRTLNVLGAIVRAWDALDGVDWALIDTPEDIEPRDRKRTAVLGQRLRDEANFAFDAYCAKRAA